MKMFLKLLICVRREAIHVPFMAKFVVFAKRIDPLEARLRVFCMTDDKEDKTLEQQEHFTEVAKSRDVEVLEGKPQFIEFAGNLVPITKSGEQLQFSFRAFRENRLPFSVRVKDQHAEAVGRCLFMREPKVKNIFKNLVQYNIYKNCCRLLKANLHNNLYAF